MEGKKCVFCGNYGLYRLEDKRIKCKKCHRLYSIKKLRRDLNILQYFCLEISAKKTTKELDLGYNTVYNRFMFFRQKIAEYLDKNFKKLSGELELDETYFGGKQKGKRGRGAYNKAIIFGILERDGIVYTSVIPDVSAETLMTENELHRGKPRCIKLLTRTSLFYPDVNIGEFLRLKPKLKKDQYFILIVSNHTSR